MNKKVLIAIFCVISLITCTVTAMGADINDEIFELKQNLNEYVNLEDTHELLNKTVLFTFGPISNIYSNIEIINGSEEQILLLNRFLKRSIFRPIVPMVIVNNLTFSVEYLKEPAMSKFSYATFHMNYSDFINLSDDAANNPDINETFNESVIFNTPHKIIVENFSGVFYFIRYRFIRFWPKLIFFVPARFVFYGYGDKLDIIM